MHSKTTHIILFTWLVAISLFSGFMLMLSIRHQQYILLVLSGCMLIHHARFLVQWIRTVKKTKAPFKGSF